MREYGFLLNPIFTYKDKIYDPSWTRDADDTLGWTVKFALNLVFLIGPSLQILDKTQTGVFPIFGFLVIPFINENCHNSTTSDDIDMKFGPVTKFDKRNMATSKKLTINLYRQILMSLSFFQLMANLEQSEKWIPDAWSVKLTFSIKVTFYLTKTENRTKKSETQLSYYCFE